MTREEAIKIVEKMTEEYGHVPTPEEYENEQENNATLEDLKRALKAKSYAAVNIAVLREWRKRRGENPYIARDYEMKWRDDDVYFTGGKDKRDNFEEEPLEDAQLDQAKQPEEKPRKKKWTKEAVAEVVLRFYKQYGRFPTGKDFYTGGAFKSMGEAAPSCWVIYSNLGEHRSSWLSTCAEILKIPPEELPTKPKKSTPKAPERKQP